MYRWIQAILVFSVTHLHLALKLILLNGIILESIFTIDFSTKASRYICSRSCIKWLKGHTDTITDVKYNCKDEHLASISLGGDLIIHNLGSGARATELKGPNGQESIEGGSEAAQRYSVKGLFPYEMFVKLYNLKQVPVEIPYISAQMIVYCLIVYAMIGFEWKATKFFWYTFFQFTCLLYMTFYGMMR